jgi:hypothetical protein
LDLPRQLPAGLPFEALDDRIAIVGTCGSGKIYTAKGLIERLLTAGARVAIIDPLGVWWGLRASADGIAPGYPVIVFGGQHELPLFRFAAANVSPAQPARELHMAPAHFVCWKVAYMSYCRRSSPMLRLADDLDS